MIYLKLAWRNLFRNKRRTFIAGIAIGIGLASLIFVDAMIIGMEKNMIHSATASFLGEGQIHRADYRQTQEVEMTINRLDQVVSDLRQESIVEDFTVRVQSLAMITSPSNVQSINLVGINPETEKNVSQIDEAIIEGNYLDGNNPRNLLIGSKLAEILEVELGDRIVITVAQAETGDLSQEMFRISGIYHFNIQEMDRAMAFIHMEKAREMLNLPGQAHEIAIQFINTSYGRNDQLPFWNKYSRFDNEALGWTKLLPQMKAAFELTQFSTLLTGLILFGVVALGIINTLFMSIHERMFEFGVLRAVGTRPLSVARLIFFEAGSLAIISIILGNILGFIITYIISVVGIDYTGIEFSGVTFRELLYPELKWFQFVKYPFWVFVFTVLTGIYPAIYAAKMSPAESLRKSI
jgi:ABC-type lipoprotein release transport system permease subunit